jgi:hypothetical protein
MRAGEEHDSVFRREASGCGIEAKPPPIEARLLEPITNLPGITVAGTRSKNMLRRHLG